MNFNSSLKKYIAYTVNIQIQVRDISLIARHKSMPMEYRFVE